MPVPSRFQHTGLVLVRATTDPGDLDVPAHLNLSDPQAVLGDGIEWLAKTWARPDVQQALRLANPGLTDRIDRIVDPALPHTRTPQVKDVRRAVISVASYLLRWQRRATPFGLFAGLAVARIGAAHARFGSRHRAVARADAEWLAAVVDRLEAHPGLRSRLSVVADNTGIIRDGRWIVFRRADPRGGSAVPLREASVRLTRPVQHALAAATEPIRYDALAVELTARFSDAAPQQIRTVLDGLVDERFLITSLRPPMTVVDALAYVIDAATTAGGRQVDDIAALLGQLDAVRALLERHNKTADPAAGAMLRATATEHMARLARESLLATTVWSGPTRTEPNSAVIATQHTLAVDVRLDAAIHIPEPVLAEAALAAGVLLRVATKPFGTAAWQDYKVRFRARYGPGALVPVRDLLADSGLGYPTGYLGAPRAHPSWRTLTDRDATILTLVQRAALDGHDEIVLTDTDIDALTVGDPDEIVTHSRTELGVTVHAATAAAVDRGNFLLHVTATPSTPTSMAGRFAELLDDTDRDRLVAGYHTDAAEHLVAQLSFPPRRPHNENVTRVPQLLPTVIALAEHPSADRPGATISVDDLAVTTDGSQLYLVQRSTGRRVVPYIPHALDLMVQSPPLARFLAEVGDGRTAVFGPLDVGAARLLPYLPRFRYRRTILAAARWLITADAFPTQPADAWQTAFERWRHRSRVPARVVFCHGELRLPLNLDHRLDRTLLRDRLAQAGRAELHEDLRSDGPDWLGRPAELLIPMTATSPKARPLPPLASPGRPGFPGTGSIVQARLAGNPARFDEILTRHLPGFVTSLDGLVERWWIGRHRDLIRLDADQHLILTFRLTDPAGHPHLVTRIGGFAADLHARSLPAQLSFVPYHQQPGRYGEQEALAAAEHVFAADTTCSIAQITVADRAGIPAQALAAVSMSRIAASLHPGQPAAGYRTLLTVLPQQTGALDRTVHDHTLRLARSDTLRAIACADEVATAWQTRDAALTTYVRHLAAQRDPVTVLPTLLHQHHIRALGVDPDFEQVTNRLARAAALRLLALAGTP